MKAGRLIIAVIAAIAALVVTAPVAEAVPPSATSYLSSCAQSATTLSALFVLDRSGSLTSTDPSGVRYDALQVALTQLASMHASNGSLAVEAAVASFNGSYFPARDVVGWTRLDSGAFGGDAGKQQRAITSMVSTARQRTAPNDGTDFEAALSGAYSDMRDRSGPGNCRVLFWFTDGKFESAVDSVPAARQRMCQKGGLLDRIRQDGIVVVGIQLNNDASDLLPMSEGKGTGGRTCGTVPIPSDWAPGLYLRADDTAALKRIFGSVAQLVEGCTPIDSTAALIDPGIRRFRGTIQTPSRLTALRLDAPDGTGINAAPTGSTRVGDYTVSVQSDDQYATFEVALPPGHGAGRWSVTTAPATSASDMSLCVFHDLHLELATPAAPLSAGKTSTIPVVAVASDGQRTNLSLFKTAAAGASAVGPDGKLRAATATVTGGSILVKLTSQPTDARVDLSVVLTLTTKSGVALVPVSARFPLALALSKEFPVVRPSDQLNLGTAVNRKPTSATVSLMGSPLGPTQVCFGAFAKVVVPREAAGTKPRVSASCVSLKASQAVDVTVSVQPIARAEGSGTALLPITLHSATGKGKTSQTVSYAIPVLWRFSSPTNAPVAIAVLVILSVISLLLPLLAMGLANLTSARFGIKGLQGGQIPVTIVDGEVHRNGSAHVIDIYRDRDPQLSVKNPRHFDLYQVRFRAKGTLNPFDAPRFTATAPPGHRIMSSVGFPIPGDRSAPVSPGLGFVVLAVVSDAALAARAREIPGRLIFLLRDTASFSDSTLADRLMNTTMVWQKISDEWRPDPQDRVDADGSPGTEPNPAPAAGPSTRRPDAFFD